MKDRMAFAQHLIGGLVALSVMAAGLVAPAGGAESLASTEQAAIKAAVQRVAESVVQIRTIGGLDTVDGTLRADGPTTGLVISPDGYILSSAFNFVEDPASILVTFASGRQTAAQLVATDHSRMLVLLKVDDTAELKAPEIAPLDEMRVGQWAIAIGRTFRADQTNVAVGIVSALDRMHGKVLQTDAAVSTANYGGPLVDIRGRAMGIVVPMAPQSTSEVAGVEWYDSGIGFAVPLAEISEAVGRMKQGEDQHAGILGIGMAGQNPHDSPAELAAVRPDSPAGLAGLKKGDRIVEIDGQPIESQTDLRFALVPRYGGESVRVVAQRGDERIERTMELAGELPAFRHAFLGILPQRVEEREAADGKSSSNDPKEVEKADGADGESDPASEKQANDDADESDDADDSDEPGGVLVRMVYPGSPAAEAGIEAGDRVTRVGETDTESIASAIAAMNSVAPGTKLNVRVEGGDNESGEPREVEITAGRLPTNVPHELPPAVAPAGDGAVNEDDGETTPNGAADKPGETIELKLPEFEQDCRVYVPRTRANSVPLGMLVWLHAPGEAVAEQTISDWQSICDRDGLLLVVPASADPARWERTELEYLRRLMERGLTQYSIDPRRVVVFGQGGGGGMAYLLSLASRDIVHGVATSAAPLPRQIRVPENEPSQRLAVLAVVPSADSARSAQLTQGLSKLAGAGYPVTSLSIVGASGQLSDDEREELARWIDTLDHF